MKSFFSDAWFRLLLAPALVCLALLIDRNYQTDLWHHLARGRVIVQEGRLLDEDRFTYTVAGQPFQDVNWLAQIAFYRLHQLGGLELLQTLNALLLSAGLLLLVWQARRLSGSGLAAAGVGLQLFLGLWQSFVLIRPQSISFVIFIILALILDQSRHQPKLLFLPPLLQALWVNVHGAFPLGVVLVGCHLLGAAWEAWPTRPWRDRQCLALAGCLLAALAAMLCNPYGYQVYEFVVLTWGRAAGRKIDEWLPPGLDTLAGKVWVTSLVGLLVLLAVSGRKLRPRQIVPLAIFLPLACGSIRMVSWWLLLAAPILAELLVAMWPALKETPEEQQPSWAAGTLLAGLAAAVLLCLPWFEAVNPLYRYRSSHRVESDLNAVASELRKQERPGRLFTRLEWSEYLTWELGPDYPVFMDGRIDIIPDRVWGEYTAVTRGRADWDTILHRYEVEYLLVDQGPYHAELREQMRAAPGAWEPIASAGSIVVYRRHHQGLPGKDGKRQEK